VVSAPRLTRSEVAQHSAADRNWRLGYSAGLRERSLIVMLAAGVGALFVLGRRGGFVTKMVLLALVMLGVVYAIEWWPVTLAVLVVLLTAHGLRRRHVRRALRVKEEPF
jgi:hypothetical protein